ncbi:alpha-mannosidase [Gorillibacterium sp. sgz5001074]|uniref:alpha-mannosidase n=1 Tax=Gorillibacterium sp. sgz5001074 TaxID=3446695 RepID=UPI003F66892C
MFWTYEKLQKQLGELAPYRYREALEIGELRFRPDEEGRIGAYPPDQGTGEWTILKRGEAWSGYDQYAWLAASVPVPAEWEGRRIVGLFDFGQTGGGNNSGFESLLFVDGQPYQGVDSNHQEVFFDGRYAGHTLELVFRLWSGLGGYDPTPAPLRHVLQTARLCLLDEAADDLYFTAKAVVETAGELSDNQPEKHTLLSMADKAFLRLNWANPGSEEFYASVAEARTYLSSELGKQRKAAEVVVRCIGHTHIDVAWLWRLAHTREKAARSFSTVLRLMEQYPDYIFLQTQPQLYAYIKKDYPDIYREIIGRVREGRWEAGGAMWLEADCNLSSGESLVRQLLYGTRFLKSEFGTDCTYLWLPDVFGYSWALPQILKKSGITAFMTTKISWNQYNRMPADTFYWRGIDGSEILTHFVTTPEPGAGEGAFFYTYNGGVTPFSVKGIWEAYRNKSLNRKLLLAYGYGDGGGGVNREMLEMRRRLDRIPGLPKVETGRADEYFRELEETVATTEEYVHTWDGELYLELHRGTYTSQAYSKRMNRKLELLFRETEWLDVLSRVKDGVSGMPDEALQEGWRIILRNQFHDIIPGSSIAPVYEDSKKEYAEAERLGRSVWEAAAVRLTADGEPDTEGITVLNGSSWERTDLVEIPADAAAPGGTPWVGPSGEPCHAQRTEEGWLLQVSGLPPMGSRSLHPADPSLDLPSDLPVAAPLFHSGPAYLESPYYRLEWDGSGRLTRIYDLEHRREVLSPGAFGNELQVFEDKPKSRHEAWDIDIYYTQKRKTVTDCRQIRLLESGPLRAAVEFTWVYGGSVLVQKLMLYAHSRRIDFETRVDWRERRQLLKAAFPVAVRSTEATYDIQFGNVKRPTHWNTSWDYARFETVGHQWADLSERNYGVSLLNDCKYGYGIKDHVMRLTLIKSAMVPDPKADQGEHRFTYALLPHAGDWYEGGTVQEAWALNNPLTYIRRSSARRENKDFSLLRPSVPNVMIDAVKRAEDGSGIIVRAHEYAGMRGELRLEAGFPVTEWQETDLMERPAGEAQTGPIRCEIRPYEIKTWLLR